MNILINGKKEELKDVVTVAKLLEQKKIRPEVVTVELNDVILEKSKHNETFLKDDDRLEFVYYMGGGEVFVNNQAKNKKMAGSILELIGETPIVRFNKIVTPDMADILA
ncbi:MAG: sulfur carrier protein ThiS, partial [Candidatus Omnitrophica bacterium]|nr:sulfur carrier protein ThiS [Candidatus Omnitrophota bacterium]